MDKMTFQERIKLATELLSKQEPVSLEKARQQAQILKEKNPESIKRWEVLPMEERK